MSENHRIQCPTKRKKHEILPLETKTKKIRRATDDGGISQLPDDILSCVFLILHWEDLMNARLVSRRWKRLCKRVFSSLRALNYNWDTMFTVAQDHCSSPLVECPNNSGHIYCPDFEDRFFRRVDQSIQYHGGAHISSFKFEFCLQMRSTASTAFLDHWIRRALNKGATELDLNFKCKYNCFNRESRVSYYRLSPCVLFKVNQVAKLKTLSLGRCILQRGIVHRMVCLKSLQLVWVKLRPDVFNGFVSGCRNLESIHLESCELPETLFIPDSFTQLKYFWVKDRLHLVKKIVISSPNLSTCSYNGHPIMLSFHKVSCLKKLCLELFEPGKEDMRYLFGQVAGENAMLESLTLSLKSHYKWRVLSLPERITRFNHLKELEISGYVNLGLNVQKIISVLDACPLLEKFSLLIVNLEEDETTVHRESFYKHLKEVLISRMAFTESYLKLATHLLEHSIALEKMILDPKAPDHATDDIPDTWNSFSFEKADRSVAAFQKFSQHLLAHRKSSVVSIYF